MTVQVQAAASLLQQARLAQLLTVGWMVIEGAIAIGAGIAAHSVALTAFGVDSGIELFSSVVVLRRLLQRSESEERGSMTGGRAQRDQARRLRLVRPDRLHRSLGRSCLGVPLRAGSLAARNRTHDCLTCDHGRSLALAPCSG